MATNLSPSSMRHGVPQAIPQTPLSFATTSAIVSGPNPGERLASYFENFFKTIVGIATLGASITFSKIVQSPVTPWINYGYGIDDIQTWISISWLIFVLALVITSIFASLLSLYRPLAVEAFSTVDHKNKKMVMWAATITSMLLVGLILASFVFLSLVTVAYTGPVGYAALGFTLFFGALGFAGIVWQSPIELPDFLRRPKEKDDAPPHPFPPPGYKHSWGYQGEYPPDPFQRHMHLRQHGSLRHKRSFSDLQDATDEKADEKAFEEYLERGGTRIHQRLSWPKHLPRPPREYRHDRWPRYSQDDHFTQLSPQQAADRDSKVSQRTLVPGASPAWDERGYAKTVPPVRYSSSRPYVAAMGIDA